MAPHMTPKELDAIETWSGKGLTPKEIKAKKGCAALHLTKVHLALKGKTYKLCQIRRGSVSALGLEPSGLRPWTW